MPTRRLVLASSSPARLGLLRAAGLQPEVVVSGVNEDSEHVDDADAMVAELARRKADAVAAQVAGALVLGADSTLELDGRTHGKPHTPAAATERWRAMRGRSGVLVTGHHLVDTASGRRLGAVGRSTVHFARLDDAEIEAYVATGEPLEVAGGFTLDGIGSAYVERIEGDASNVIGLSVPLVRMLAAGIGIAWTDLWR